jgi:DNA excision repair protein ERCC-6
MVGSRVPVWVKPVMTAENSDMLANLSSAYDYYKLFQPASFAEEIVYQSKLYAVQKDKKQALEVMNIDTYRCTEAMLLHSGYHTVPRRWMLWQQKADCYNQLVAENIRRREVDAVLSCLHFRDNSNIDEDGYYKVRPIFQNLNKCCSRWTQTDDGVYSVDESMIPYYGRHSSKQYIRGKPVRYGYKVWSLCSADGSGVWFEPYCGRHTLIEDKGLGQGPNVVLDLVAKAKLSPGSEVCFDNLFTSFPLLDKLSEMEIGGTGTVRQNRLNRVPIMKKKDLEKKTVDRGTSHVVYREDQVVVAWKDSKAVYVASNKHHADISQSCRRYCRVTKKDIAVPIPDMIRQYNSGMGGVDLLDNMVAVYRVPYRIKKWWFPIYTWSLSVSAVNAWRMRMKVTGKKEPFLDFLRELVIDMFTTHGTPLSSGGGQARFLLTSGWMVSTIGSVEPRSAMEAMPNAATASSALRRAARTTRRSSCARSVLYPSTQTASRNITLSKHLKFEWQFRSIFFSHWFLYVSICKYLEIYIFFSLRRAFLLNC